MHTLRQTQITCRVRYFYHRESSHDREILITANTNPALCTLQSKALFIDVAATSMVPSKSAGAKSCFTTTTAYSFKLVLCPPCIVKNANADALKVSIRRTKCKWRNFCGACPECLGRRDLQLVNHVIIARCTR